MERCPYCGRKSVRAGPSWSPRLCSYPVCARQWSTTAAYESECSAADVIRFFNQNDKNEECILNEYAAITRGICLALEPFVYSLDVRYELMDKIDCVRSFCHKRPVDLDKTRGEIRRTRRWINMLRALPVNKTTKMVKFEEKVEELEESNCEAFDALEVKIALLGASDFGDG